MRINIRKESIMNIKTERVKLNKPVFWVPMIIMIGMVVISFANQELFSAITQRGTTWISNNTMWFVCLNMIIQTTFTVLFIFLPIGKKRLGGPNARPTHKTVTWFAMCLTSSIGSGIIFYGVAQPMTYFMDVATQWGMDPGSSAAAIKAMAQSSWEWSAQYWFYTLYAVAIGLAAYNYGQQLRVSSFVYLLNGKPARTWVRNLIDILSVIAIVAGVTSSLGSGIMQIGSGFNMIFGIPVTKMLWLIIAVGIVAFFVLTSISGVERGISKLADLNFYIYVVVLAFVFIVGPGKYILSLFTESMSYLFGNIIETAGYTGVLDNATWTKDWPFWQFVGASGFAPIFGIFFAKISYGRTIKEIALGMGVIPAFFNVIWFCIFGGYAFHLQTSGKYDVWQGILDKGAEASMFDLLRTLPLGSILVVVFLVIVIISFVTMANSTTTSVALVSTTTKLNSDGSGEPPTLIKFVWGALMGATAYTFISFAGIAGAKSAIQLFDFPLHVMTLIVLAILIKRLFGKSELKEVYAASKVEDSSKADETA